MNNAEKQAEIYTDLAAVHKSLHNEREVTLYNARIDSLLSATPSMSANLFLIKGNNAYQNGNWEVAISCFKRFLASDPKDDKRFSSLQKLRDSYAKIGDDENALAYSQRCVDDWKEAFANNPSEKYVIYQNHYPFQIKVGDYEGALASIDSIQRSTAAIGTDFAYGELLMDRARVYGLLKRWKDAVRDYQSADSLMSISPRTVAVRDKLESLVPLFWLI